MTAGDPVKPVEWRVMTMSSRVIDWWVTNLSYELHNLTEGGAVKVE